MRFLSPIAQVIGRVVQGGESSVRPVGWTRTGSFRRRDISLIAGLVLPLLLWSAGVGLAQTVDTTLWVTDGQVRSIVSEGSLIYIGGNFTQVGPATGGGVAIDASTGAGAVRAATVGEKTNDHQDAHQRDQETRRHRPPSDRARKT